MPLCSVGRIQVERWEVNWLGLEMFARVGAPGRYI